MGARAGLLALAVVLVAGCQAAEPRETPAANPAAVPSGPPTPAGPTATGPIVELGSGVTSGLGWRYLLYPSDEEWCRQLETAAGTDSDCDIIGLEEGGAFGTINESGRVIHGIVTADAATVWLVVNNTPTVPALLMPLADAGIDGVVAFLGIAPTGADVTHVMAVRSNGEVLGTRELP